jgi:hypothetical protein
MDMGMHTARERVSNRMEVVGMNIAEERLSNRTEVEGMNMVNNYT